MSKPSPFRKKIDAIAATSPEVAPLLAAFEVVLAEMAEPSWSAATAHLSPSWPAGAPLLQDARISLPQHAFFTFLLSLFDAALAKQPRRIQEAARAALRRDDFDALGFLDAAIDFDIDRLGRLASTFGDAAPAVFTLAQLAAMPLLQAQRKAFHSLLPSAWPSDGFCPLCAAYPAMAELRGLEKKRRLRCGRCGADAEAPPLGCPFCGESYHRNLTTLLPAEGGEARKVLACDTCGAYSKTLATLVAWPAESVFLEDLATVDLDIAATERGRKRPLEPGRELGISFTPAAERRGLRGFFS